MLKKPILNNLLKFFGFFLLVFSLFFLVKVISELELSFTDFLSIAADNPLVLISCGLLYVFTYILGSFIWSLWVVNLDESKKIKTQDYLVLMAVYFYTNLQKYIPGNFFQFVGRNLKGNQYGFLHKSLFSASFLEIILSIGSGLLFVLLMAPLFWSEIYQIVNYFNIKTIITVSIAIVTAALLTVFWSLKIKPFKRNSINHQIQKYAKIFYFSIFSFLMTFALFGLINMILFSSIFDITFTIKNFAIFSFGFAISWLVGFVIPGSPGGIIVREAVFVLILNNLVAEKELIYVIVFIRFLGLVIEILLFFIGWLFFIRHDNK